MNAPVPPEPLFDASSADVIVPARSTLGEEVVRLVAVNGGKSGLQLLDDNLEAFAARAMLARQAEETLDLQYYYWKGDLSGQLLLREVIAAADRGVHVRILLDDFNVGDNDAGVRTLARHPCIAVKYFNPCRNRESAWRRGIELVLNAWSATRRMHNKSWIVDTKVAIVGGRNIGDPYFDASASTNFADLDIMAMGPAVGDTQAIFNRYWQSKAAVHRRALLRGGARLARLRKRLADVAESAGAAPYLNEVRRVVAERKHTIREPIYWSDDVRVIADPPEKAAGHRENEWIADIIFQHLRGAGQRIQVISPYFIPGTDGVEQMRNLRARGVDVSVLTNSLASTDVAAVHGGYAKYRKPMLEAGVRLYELKAAMKKMRISAFGSSSASLHTKAYAIDGRAGFVGSYNFDPRSRSINTEMGILFEQPELAKRIEEVFAREVHRDNAYSIGLKEGALCWDNGAHGPQSEPGASWTRRTIAKVIGWLPLETQM